MNIFRDMPVRRKLKAISMIAGGLALIVASMAFVAYDYFSFRASFERRVEILAEILSKQTTAALSFRDSKASEEILDSLSAETHVLAAAVYDERGALFARYPRSGLAATLPALEPAATVAGYHSNDLVTLHSVVLNQQKIGSMYLRFDLGEISTRLRLKMAIVAAVFLVSLLIAFVLTSRLETIVTGPILHLAATVASVSDRKDYTVRAKSESRDEFGGLILGFNEMLGQIERRDHDLEHARGELEQRVEERTSDLIRVNVELKKEVSDRLRAEESLKDSEDRFRQLVESSPDAIAIVSDDRFTFVNRGAAELFGAQTSEDLRGRPFSERFPGVAGESVSRSIRHVVDEKRPSPLQEERVLRLNGKPVDVEFIALPFSSRQGRAVQVVLRDITKRKELDRMKNEFISTVSHELRTPLTSIRGSLKLVVAGVTGILPAKTMTMVTIAHDSCERLIHLVNDILDMQKIEAGKITLNLRPLDVAVQIDKALEANRAYAQTFGVSMRFEHATAGLLVMADADRLIQVLTNLLSNAVKFSPRNGEVCVSLDEHAGKVRISVADHGSGIPEEFRPRIFQKFSQADSSDTKSKQGTGLGLSITKAIVDRLGGAISFESPVGGGTTFLVDLPRHVEPRTEAVVDAPGLPSILICEDDRDFSTVLQLSLQTAGFHVDLAKSAADARALLARNRYSAMTLDLVLPDEDGASLLQSLRQQPETRNLPVVIVSAYLDEARRRLSSQNSGIVDWLEKPIDAERLKTTLQWVVRSGKRQAKILHVEDDPHQIRTVRELLQGTAAVCPVATAADGAALLRAETFDLVILEMRLRDGSGLGLLPQAVRADGSAIPVVLYSADEVPEAAAKQAAATILKSTGGPEQLVRAVRTLLLGPGARVSAEELSGATV